MEGHLWVRVKRLQKAGHIRLLPDVLNLKLRLVQNMIHPFELPGVAVKCHEIRFLLSEFLQDELAHRG